MDNIQRYDTQHHHLINSKDYVASELIKRNLFLIESTYTNIKNGCYAFTEDGYIVKVSPASFYHNQKNPIFSTYNPYTIYNINRYIYLNNCETILISKEYHGNNRNLSWMCKCGNTFLRTWACFQNGATECPKCGRIGSRFKMDFSDISNDFMSRGYILDPAPITSKKQYVNYICRKHKDKGYQKITLTKFYDRNQGCRYCAIDKSKVNRTTAEACREATLAKGMGYIETFFDSKTMIRFICPLHKEKGIQSCSITHMKISRFGCKYCNMSKYTNEEKIEQLLVSWNLEYYRQYTFKECKDKKVLPFDFYIPSFNACIEYQGEHHYRPIKRNSSKKDVGLNEFNIVQKHDRIKREFCKNNNIFLIEVPYWENYDIDNFVFDEFVKHKFIIETTSA